VEQRGVRIGIAGREAQRREQKQLGVGERPARAQQAGEIKAHSHVIRLDARRPAQRGFRFVQPARASEHHRIVVKGADVFRPLREGGFERRDGRGRVALRVMDVGQRDVGFREFGLVRERQPQMGCGFVQGAAGVEQDREVVVGRRVIRID
jgi:hypothetical protein